jgi:hypothetical protein
MKNIFIKKSNKGIVFQQKNKNKIILTLKTNNRFLNHNKKFLLSKNVENCLKRFQLNQIKYSTLLFVLQKQTTFLSNKKKSEKETIQLFTEWSLESGIFNKENFHFNY